MSQIDFQVLSSIDRDDLYAELREWAAGDFRQFGEVVWEQDRGRFAVRLFSPGDGRDLLLDFEEFIALLTKAKAELQRIEGIQE